MTSPSTNTNPVPADGPRRRTESISDDRSHNRVVSNARLASPIPSMDRRSLSPMAAAAAAGGHFRGRTASRSSGHHTPLAGLVESQASGPGTSALADALQRASVAGSHPSRSASQDHHGRSTPSNYGTLGDTQSVNEPYEDFDIVRRHLAGPTGASPAREGGLLSNAGQGITAKASKQQLADQHSRDPSQAPGIDENEFSSLRMQGGDITRDIYRRAEAEASYRGRPQRSRSVYMPHSNALDSEPDASSINQPGGFRRDHIRRHAQSPKPSIGGPSAVASIGGTLEAGNAQHNAQPQFVARNFFEFLSLYGHFAGEDVDEDYWSDDDDETGAGERGIRGMYHENDDEAAHEGTALLKSAQRRRRKDAQQGPKAGTGATVLMLLKSFVGTGVLFLPRAFLNGGMFFSIFVMIGVAALSYYCFLLLTTSRIKLKGSFAEMGEMVAGKWLRFLINASLVISQIGFASAYIVFTSENLQAFILAVSKCKTNIEIKYMIMMQLIIFLPLSLYRNLNNISFVVYIADLFIVLGLVYLYYFDISTLITQRGVSDIVLFNPKGWTLFIGTAIFTFEGIGLIIPIQDGMKKPEQLPAILGGVMVIISVIFVSMGALAYAAFGSKTETVIILNMPQDNKFVNGVQFLYSLAILLSTPMQIFPAITIMENALFKKSGKYNKFIKWRKNGFRFCTVMVSALIAWIGANDLDKFVALVGSFACIPLVYIYPPIIHYKAIATNRLVKYSDVLLCVFGLVLMAYTSTLTIVSWASGSGSAKSPGYCDSL